MECVLYVVPEECLRNENVVFHLGCPINQILTMLQQNARILNNIKFFYSKQDPLGRDSCIQLSNGIKLTFDARSQLLKLIEVENLEKVVLKYGEQIFSEPGAEATMERAEECFGSTLPGEYDEQQKVYIQSWRGLSCSFSTNNSSHVEVAPGFGPNLRSLKYDSISQPRLARMSIFKGTSLSASETEPLEVPLSCYCGQNRLIKARSIHDPETKRITGVSFTFLTEDQSKSNSRSSSGGYEIVEMTRPIMFNDSVTTVLSALGAPSKIFYKSDDKMSIHRGGNKETLNPQPHFFFNYFSMGFDILFDFTTKQVIKFVLHNNIPGHYDFGIYTRCEFEVKCSFGNEEDAESVVLSSASKMTDLAGVADSQQPVVISRCSTEDRNPFGPTFAFGSRQIVVEVIDNKHIAGITIFNV